MAAGIDVRLILAHCRDYMVWDQPLVWLREVTGQRVMVMLSLLQAARRSQMVFIKI